jgi:tripartite-type tricarboxylate transporter receptor subunit TctC
MGEMRAAPIMALLLICLAMAAPLRAQDYPARPVHLIAGFAPGSAADLTARVLGNAMGQTLGQQFVVENRTGAASGVAAEFVARAAKDGYTLFLASSAVVSNAAVNTKLPYDLARDFAPIALATSVPVILVVNPATGVKTVQELIALVKSKPGEIVYGSTGAGASPHLAAELFSIRIGVKLVHVPYQGSPQAVTDLIAGRTTLMFSPASTVISQIEAGTLRALASATAKRSDIAPNLPTMEEAGLPDFDTSIWFGLVAPAGTPRPIINKLASAVDAAVQSSEVLSQLRMQGFEPLRGGPEEFARYIESETKKWRDVARAAGLRQ